MSRQLWGELTDADDLTETEDDKAVPTSLKEARLKALENINPKVEKISTIKVNDPLVTQTIEVMKQTEMLQSLIDTYSNKSGTSNYLLNPCQMIPEVNFPPENVAELLTDEKFPKIFAYASPETRFAQGTPRSYPKISSEICRALLKRAICGQLRITGFTDAADSALVLLTDAVDEFLRNLFMQIREVNAIDPELDRLGTIDMKALEKAYMAMTNNSLTQVHNFLKHKIIARNRAEISEFKSVLYEYDKLMKESQRMQKDDFQDGEFMNILEMPESTERLDADGANAQGSLVFDDPSQQFTE